MSGKFWAILAIYVLGLVIMGIGAGFYEYGHDPAARIKSDSEIIGEMLIWLGAIVIFAAIYGGLETLGVGEFIAALSIMAIGFFVIWNVGEWLERKRPAPHHKITNA